MNQFNLIENEKMGKAQIIKEILLWIFQIAIVISIAVVVVYYWGQKTAAVGQSMEPTVNAGCEVWMNKLAYMISTPRRNDVIVFQPNGNENAHFYIKRVVALPGETVQIKDGAVFVDGEKLEEKWDAIKDPGIADEELKLDVDEYFVLGDNRNNSEDSRYADIGTVNLSDIEGKAWLWSKKGFHFGRIH